MIHGNTLTFNKDLGWLLFSQEKPWYGEFVDEDRVYKIYIGYEEVEINEFRY